MSLYTDPDYYHRPRVGRSMRGALGVVLMILGALLVYWALR